MRILERHRGRHMLAAPARTTGLLLHRGLFKQPLDMSSESVLSEGTQLHLLKLRVCWPVSARVAVARLLARSACNAVFLRDVIMRGRHQHVFVYPS